MNFIERCATLYKSVIFFETASHVEVTHQTWSRIKNGKSTWNQKMLYFDISPSYLLIVATPSDVPTVSRSINKYWEYSNSNHVSFRPPHHLLTVPVIIKNLRKI
jgi:hypothetical protein